jgi:hypothetical protein
LLARRVGRRCTSGPRHYRHPTRQEYRQAPIAFLDLKRDHERRLERHRMRAKLCLHNRGRAVVCDQRDLPVIKSVGDINGPLSGRQGQPCGRGFILGPRYSKRLPLVGIQELLVDILKRHSDISKILDELRASVRDRMPEAHVELVVHHAVQVLEVMVNNYWVECGVKKNRPVLEIGTPVEGEIIHYARTAKKERAVRISRDEPGPAAR